ncbi:SNF1-related protein kinase catalytic subunit alpha KIN10-like [Rutidosis leptorrhynchoides]|uniref:SNF1-related protein kinase catalytic subunit alpha KIN10-like n=1 Tax=Rutidosis leptorrhynchoides TaxID=125765 RepID=UPI003A9A1C27
MDRTNRGVGSIDSLLRNYNLGKTLGHGSFGKVKIAEHILTGHKVAIKILNRRKLKNPEMEEKVRREIKICRLFVHPHIIRLYEVIETPLDIYVVMEYVKSGELFDYIVEKGRLHENEARKIFQQIVSGVEFCHRNMVVHRDLKPENILLDSRGNVKVADFGLSNIMRDGHFLKTSCGSPNYAAPEVVSGKLYAGPEVDIWSCGVILYALLCGTLPFDDENIPNLFKKIKSGIYTLPSHLSPGARDLIPRMLVVDPMKRITIADLRQHYWFKSQLPRYLAVPAPDATDHLKKLDEEIMKKVINMGFEINRLIQSLHNRVQDDATVAYYLLFDNQSRIAGGYLGAEVSESLDNMHVDNMTDRTTHNRLTRDNSIRSNLPGEKKWQVGMQIPATPRDIMIRVLELLRDLNVCWKKIGVYNIKCRWVYSVLPAEPITAQQLYANNYLNSATTPNNIRIQSVVKFEIQLYKTPEDRYLVDIQRINGPQLLFLDLCAALILHLETFIF